MGAYIRLKDRSTVKGVFLLYFFTGLLFCIISFLPALATIYSNKQKNKLKYWGAFLGSLGFIALLGIVLFASAITLQNNIQRWVFGVIGLIYAITYVTLMTYNKEKIKNLIKSENENNFFAAIKSKPNIIKCENQSIETLIGENGEKVTLCPNYGYQMFENDKYCENCGYPEKNMTNKINYVEQSDIIQENKNHSDNQKQVENHNLKEDKKLFIIKTLKALLIFSFVILILFTIIYPIVINSIKNTKLKQLEIKTISLTNLDSNQQIYVYLKDNYNYLYIKDIDENLMLYKFYNKDTTYYANATSAQIKNYFGSNIHYGHPTLMYVMPNAIISGYIIGTLLFIFCVILLFIKYKATNQAIFALTQTNEIFKKLKSNLKNNDITKYEYKKLINIEFKKYSKQRLEFLKYIKNNT